MLEVEMKFSAADTTTLEQRLRAWGAIPEAPLREEDHYHNAPDRDFARTDEALRLRRIGPTNFVTYKGPKRDAQTKTRTEVEVPLAEGDRPAGDFLQLLGHLGYRPVAIVRKHRRIYRVQREGYPVEICLDEVDGVGSFVEVEIVTAEEQLEPAKALVMKLAAELGLGASERRSYLEMWLTNQRSTP